MLSVESIGGPHTSILGAHLVALVEGSLSGPEASALAVRMADATDVDAIAASLPSSDFVVALCVGPVVRAVLRGTATLRVNREDGGEITFRSLGDGLVRAIETECVSAELVIEGDGPAAPGIPRPVSLGVGTASILRYSTGPTITAVPQPARSPSARATVATLAFDSGELVPVDRTVLIGRSPRVERSALGDLPTLVPVDSPTGGVSRLHLRISIEGSGVLVEDLHSTNGTEITATNGLRFRVLPGEPSPLTDGMVVSLGDRVSFRVVSS